MSRLSRFAGIVALLVAIGLPSLRADPPSRPSGLTVAALIDRLADVKEGGIGYSGSVTGSVFLPLDHAGRLHVMLLFQSPPVASEAMRELVKRGAAAVPELLAHLDDRRPTKLDAVWGLSALLFSSGCDTNRRITVPAKLDVEDEKVDSDMPLTPRWRSEVYTPKVGDLCFVALGQIVNRQFDAVRYVPSGITVVTAPTRSPALRAEVRRQWGGLTAAKHRAALLADCQTPDTPERWIGACKRLAYYYPDAVEAVALKLLKQPEYDGGEVQEFIQKTLYETADAKERKKRLDDFVATSGLAARDGVQLELFTDLESAEAEEWRKKTAPEKSPAARPRRMLAELYGWPKDVKSGDRPTLDVRRASEKAELLEEGLIFDESPKIDRAFAEYLSGKPDDTVARACLERLVGRGFDADVERTCRRLMKVSHESWRPTYERILDRLGWTPLHVAVDRGDPDMVRKHLARGARPDPADRRGRTPLHLASTAGNAELVRTLLEAKAAVDPKDSDGRTPAQLASDEDHAEVVRLLGSHGCAVTDVFLAASLDNVERLAVLLGAERGAVNRRNKHGATPLFLAAREGSAKVAAALLAAGADANAADEEGWAPLHVAITCGREEVVRVLLRGKADVSRRVGDSGPEPLHLAAAEGRAKVVETLLAHKADPESETATNERPLHLAVTAGSVPAAKALLEHGARVDAADKEGETPLHYASKQGNVELARLLLDHGAKVGAAARDRREQPLYFAAVAGSREVIELLLARKADLNATTERGETALHAAAKVGRVEAARLLLDRGARVDAVTQSRETPLHLAAAYAPPAVAELLLDRKADPNARDLSGETPLHHAVDSTNLKVVSLLLKRGADRGVKNKDGKTPLDLAEDKYKASLGKKELIAILKAPANREPKSR
jgi:ankyrin repeat protein